MSQNLLPSQQRNSNYDSLDRHTLLKNNKSVQAVTVLKNKYRVGKNSSNLSKGKLNAIPSVPTDHLLKYTNHIIENKRRADQEPESYDKLQSVEIKERNKQYADIRVKLGSKKSPDHFDNESIPSEISEDMWGELPKLHDYNHKLQIQKEKQDHMQKLQNVKDTLDQQVKQQKLEKQQRQMEVKKMDREILNKAAEELELERKKKEEKKQKVFKQKQMQDEMLLKAQE